MKNYIYDLRKVDEETDIYTYESDLKPINGDPSDEDLQSYHEQTMQWLSWRQDATTNNSTNEKIREYNQKVLREVDKLFNNK